MLTDTAVRNAKPAEKPYKITDSGGMYLLVNSTGKYWRMDYRFGDKRKTLAMGIYPAITKAINKQAIQHAQENTFKAVALEWHAKQSTKWAETTATSIGRYLEKDIFPWLGSRSIKV